MNIDVKMRPEPAPAPPHGGDPRPVVALPNQGMSGLAIAVIMAVIAVLLFLVLDAQRKRPARESVETSRGQASAFAPPPPLLIPPEPAPMPQPVVTIPLASPPGPAPQPRAFAPPVIVPMVPTTQAAPIVRSLTPTQVAPRLEAPALIYDAGDVNEGVLTPPPRQIQGGGPQARSDAAGPPAASRVERPARPTRIVNQTMVVPTGTLIRAVLETPIDTSRPGLARAIVSREARGFDGRRVLVPRGSRLIGEYDAEVRTGQRKVLINWTQLVRPDGSVIRLDSPAADAIGGTGMPGRVRTFFFQRFLNAVLQTAMTVGGSLTTWSSDAPVVVGLPNTVVNNVGGQGGLVGQTPQPKITVKQGAAFNVFVARDLDFSGAPLAR